MKLNRRSLSMDIHKRSRRVAQARADGAVPLKAAAAELGVSQAALRWAIKRGMAWPEWADLEWHHEIGPNDRMRKVCFARPDEIEEAKHWLPAYGAYCKAERLRHRLPGERAAHDEALAALRAAEDAARERQEREE